MNTSATATSHTLYGQSMMTIIGLITAIVSYALLVPGITLPMMTLTAEFNLFGLSTPIINETRSIWQTMMYLHEQGYSMVAILVGTFSLVIPIIKGLITLVVSFLPSRMGWQIVSLLSKWSMADVFLVAILVAFFTAQATTKLEAELLEGFYWFAGFCLLSIISGQLLSAAGLRKIQNEKMD